MSPSNLDEKRTFEDLVKEELPPSLKRSIDKPSCILPWKVELLLCILSIPILVVAFILYFYSIITPTV